MMGPAQRHDPKLFYVGIRLDERVPADHPLRRIAAAIDFNFVRREVAELYGRRGNPSVDPAVLLKLMFLLYYENVPSERRLMRDLPMRLDWMWFCGYDLDEAIPDHSVISKARRRWGPEAFEAFFQQVLWRCIDMGLVDGEVVHADASVVRAHADPSKMRPALREVAHTLYDRLEAEAEPPQAPPTVENATDPEARLTCVYGKTVLGYKGHRLVDDRSQIITATVTTHAAVPEGEALETLLDQHEQHTGGEVEIPVADKAYGTAENYHKLHERHMTPCIPHREALAPGGHFAPKDFAYDRGRDCLICPAGQTLKRSGWDASEQRVRYRASAAACAACPLRARCTDSGQGRRVGRLLYQDEVDWADGCLSATERRRLMRRRKICAEGSFADAANNHGFKQARWRGLMRMRIQNLLIAAVQNVRKLLKACQRGRAAALARVRRSVSAVGSILRLHAMAPGGCRPGFLVPPPLGINRAMFRRMGRTVICLSTAPSI